ncbi:MAG: hypothetical protein CMR00_12735 [[Chlorobium] sp. 445]|nr:MAG: hypothetical protein CMR00_12735 [[Chlorobium] sp. 445]
MPLSRSAERAKRAERCRLEPRVGRLLAPMKVAVKLPAQLILWITVHQRTLSVVKSSGVWFIVIPYVAVKAAVVPATIGIASPDPQSFTWLYYNTSQLTYLIPFSETSRQPVKS